MFASIFATQLTKADIVMDFIPCHADVTTLVILGVGDFQLCSNFPRCLGILLLRQN